MRCTQFDQISLVRWLAMMEVLFHNFHRSSLKSPPPSLDNRLVSENCNSYSAFYDNQRHKLTTHSIAFHFVQSQAPDRKFSFRQCSRRHNYNCRCPTLLSREWLNSLVLFELIERKWDLDHFSAMINGHGEERRVKCTWSRVDSLVRVVHLAVRGWSSFLALREQNKKKRLKFLKFWNMLKITHWKFKCQKYVTKFEKKLWPSNFNRFLKIFQNIPQ